MALFDRLSYALLGAIVGALIGVAGWWLYGLANSLTYHGPGMHPVLRHWLIYSSGTFALLGLLFRAFVIEALSDTVSAIVHFEFNETPGRTARICFAVVLVALIVLAIWFTTPSAV